MKLISKTMLSSDIANIPEESNTLDTEEPGPSGTATRPLCSVYVPSGQPEKVIRTEKRQSKRKGKGKGREKKRKTSEDSDDKCSVCNKSFLEGEFWNVVIIVPYGIIEIVYIYKMNRSG